MRRKSTVWPEIRLERWFGAATLRHQIERQIGQAILEGRLTHGSRLASSRLMAKLLGVSRGTVVEAYEALLEAGLIVSSQGSGMRVCRLLPRVPSCSSLERAACAAHYPARTCLFEDGDGTPLYLNVLR